MKNDWRHLKLWQVSHELTFRFMSEHNKLGTIMKFFSWDKEDFASEFYLHVLTHNRNSTHRFRVRWLEANWDWNDIGDNKQFRAWVKIELKSFVGHLYYREIKRRLEEGEDDKSLLLEYVEEEELYKFTTEGPGELMIDANDIIGMISNWMVANADDREKFIYLYLLGMTELQINNDRVLNYPRGSVSLKTFYNHRAALLAKMGEVGNVK
jgi:hypothetical protein